MSTQIGIDNAQLKTQNYSLTHPDKRQEAMVGLRASVSLVVYSLYLTTCTHVHVPLLSSMIAEWDKVMWYVLKK